MFLKIFLLIQPSSQSKKWWIFQFFFLFVLFFLLHFWNNWSVSGSKRLRILHRLLRIKTTRGMIKWIYYFFATAPFENINIRYIKASLLTRIMISQNHWFLCVLQQEATAARSTCMMEKQSLNCTSFITELKLKFHSRFHFCLYVPLVSIKRKKQYSVSCIVKNF